MSSSTMIHGVTTRWASAMRTPADAATIAPSQSHAGSPATRGGPTLTAFSPTVPSGPGRCQPHARKCHERSTGSRHDPRIERGAGERRWVVDPGFDGGLGDPPEHRIAHRVTPGCDLEGGDVPIRHGRECVLALDVRAGGGGERSAVVGRHTE